MSDPIEVLKEQTKEMEDLNIYRESIGLPVIPIVKVPLPEKEKE